MVVCVAGLLPPVINVPFPSEVDMVKGEVAVSIHKVPAGIISLVEGAVGEEIGKGKIVTEGASLPTACTYVFLTIKNPLLSKI